MADDLVPQDPGAQVAALQKGDQLDIKELANRHTKKSIDTLVDCQRRKPKKYQFDGSDYVDPAPSHAVRERAAKDLIDIAHGRPDTRDTEIAPGGFHVTINTFTLGGPVEQDVPVVVPSELERVEAPAIEAEFEDVTVTAPDWRDELRAQLAENAKSG